MAAHHLARSPRPLPLLPPRHTRTHQSRRRSDRKHVLGGSAARVPGTCVRRRQGRYHFIHPGAGGGVCKKRYSRQCDLPRTGEDRAGARALWRSQRSEFWQSASPGNQGAVPALSVLGGRTGGYRPHRAVPGLRRGANDHRCDHSSRRRSLGLLGAGWRPALAAKLCPVRSDLDREPVAPTVLLGRGPLGIPVVPEIARVIGISPRAVHAAFNKALRRQTEEALDAWHRTELGGLAMEAANIWRLMDLTDNKNDWKAQASLEDRLMRIHIRRAKLLGLDAPTNLDVSGIYRTGADEMSEERRETHRAWQAMPLEEQARIYDAFDAARARLNAPIEPTATVTIGSDNRNSH